MLDRRTAILAGAAGAVTAWGQQTQPLSREELDAIPLTRPHRGKSSTRTLFDGRSLSGWRGNTDWWSVRDGALVAKSSTKVPTNFLFTDEVFTDFRLTLQSRMVESENHAGVCFWSPIAEKGDNKWYTQGPLVVFPRPSMWDYREARGLRVHKPTTRVVTSQFEWIKVEMLVQGNCVRAAFNGVEVLEWRQADASLVVPGPIGVQMHAWSGPQEVHYKDLVIETFPQESRLQTVAPR